ncbi:c-type cytochrome [Acidocella aromatica]|uniref:Mono/diheme cytochrome c family protein n=1 Tax=Acidocella aromatica TaxID=1303579 RepID=A0A840VPF6_9PROT|nr:cytochrome c [Acidocella aromatica]MBB5372182.1 mono/diheme cytochrome c family protein [Acidocella aromatica]
MNSLKTRVLLGAALVAGSAAAALAAPPALYTADQAKAGADVYAQNCAMCHGADLSGAAGPALVGQAFANAANKFTVGPVFTEVVQQMPAGQPASLTHEQYEDAFAYILQQNGYPAGTTKLDYTATMSSKVPLVSEKP